MAEPTATDKLRNEKDPALIAYLKSLGVDPDYVGPKDDTRRVVIKELQVIFKDHPTPQTLSFATQEDVKNAKKTPLVIKEGCEYKMKILFRVQHDAVAGFKIENTLSRVGKEVKDLEMLGSFPPSHEFKPLELPRSGWNEAPEGTLYRGDYAGTMKFTDDDKNDHLTVKYAIHIGKDYPK